MKYVLSILWIIMIWITPAISQASALEEYNDAHDVFIAAGACTASYSDRIGKLTKSYLEQDGWKIDSYVQSQGQEGARFLLAKKDLGDGKPTYLLAFVGTETKGDINFDLQFKKVYFDGNSLDSFTANAEKKDIPDTLPKVHRGFLDFVESGLKAKAKDKDGLSLVEMLLANKDSNVYLVGHSLGGAAATLAGASLLNMGVNPEQIKVITFGAPAVGNAAFAAKYDKTLNLTRVVVSGDPVTGILQTLVGGYRQFGKELRFKNSKDRDQPHSITEYVDASIKNYYDKHDQLLRTEPQLIKSDVPKNAVGTGAYVTPLKNTLPEALSKEFWYMHEAMKDEYRSNLPGVFIAAGKNPIEWKNLPASANYSWVIVPEISVTKLQRERNVYYITLSQTVYDFKTGSMLEKATFSTATYTMTPLEAFMHDLKGINYAPNSWMLKIKNNEGLEARLPVLRYFSFTSQKSFYYFSNSSYEK